MCSPWRSTAIYGDTTDHLPVYGTVKGKIVESKDRVHTKLNYATSYPGSRPGSTFKMFTLAAALEKGLSTSTTFNLAELHLSDELRSRTRPAIPAVQCRVPTTRGGQLPPFGAGYVNSEARAASSPCRRRPRIR